MGTCIVRGCTKPTENELRMMSVKVVTCDDHIDQANEIVTSYHSDLLKRQHTALCSLRDIDQQRKEDS